MAGIMNAVGYDAMTAGNHDFNFGTERMLELSAIMDFPLLAANVKDADGENLFESHVIFDMPGVKVGVFGITTPETLTKTDPRITEGLEFADPAETASEMVAELTSAGCDIIVALVHLGEDGATIPEYRSDAIAAVPGIDIIIDGHSHTLLENGRISGDVLIAQTGAFGGHIGVVEVTASGERRAATIPVFDDEDETDNEIMPDPAIVERIAEEEAKIEPITSEVLGSTAFLLNGEREYIRAGETNLSNLVTDSMLWATGADAAFLGGGNIRASIDAGDITKGDVLNVLPFSNLLVTIELRGADLLEVLEHGVSLYPELSGRFIQISGIRFTFDPDADPGQRVVTAVMSDGKAIDRDAVYTVATSDFIAAGGDGYNLESGRNLVYYGDDAEALANYIKTGPAINAEADGRVSTHGDATAAQAHAQQAA